MPILKHVNTPDTRTTTEIEDLRRSIAQQLPCVKAVYRPHVIWDFLVTSTGNREKSVHEIMSFLFPLWQVSLQSRVLTPSLVGWKRTHAVTWQNRLAVHRISPTILLVRTPGQSKFAVTG